MTCECTRCHLHKWMLRVTWFFDLFFQITRKCHDVYTVWHLRVTWSMHLCKWHVQMRNVTHSNVSFIRVTWRIPMRDMTDACGRGHTYFLVVFIEITRHKHVLGGYSVYLQIRQNTCDTLQTQALRVEPLSFWREYWALLQKLTWPMPHALHMGERKRRRRERVCVCVHREQERERERKKGEERIRDREQDREPQRNTHTDRKE